MKKIFALLLVLGLSVSLAGCNAKEVINKSLSRGVVDGNVYTSEYIGLTFTKPDTWVYATDEQMNELMGASAELMGQTDYEAAVSDLLSIYDMQVTDPATNNNINIVYENLKLNGNESMTEEQYIEFVKQNLGSIAELTYSFGEIENATLGGVEFKKILCDVDYSGIISMKQVMYIKNIDGFMCGITVTIADGTDPSVIEGYFAPIK